MPRAAVVLIAATLLVGYAGLATATARQMGLSFDEGLQLAVGHNLWVHQDYRIEGGNGDLIKRWATLPFLWLQPNFVGPDDPLWRRGDAYELGHRFLFTLGNSPETLLRWSRAMNTLLGVVTGLLIFLVSRRQFGAAGGLLSLALYAFCPHMLAFGSVVSTDLSITLTLFASTWWCWRLLHRITVGWLLGSLFWAGLVVLAKPTALVMFPIAGVLIAVRLVRGAPLRLEAGRWRYEWVRRRTQLGVIAALLVLHVAAGWGALWTHYGFRYAASPMPSDRGVTFFQPTTHDEIPAPIATTLRVLRESRLLPEGFLAGIESLLACDDALGAFAGGEWRMSGWYWFFPYAIWVKTHPAVFALLLGAAVAAALSWRRRRYRPGALFWYEATPWLALIGCYLAVAMTENINLGLRHVLPIYPALYVLAGAVALGWDRWAAWPRRAALALLAWFAFDSLSHHPHYLAYFGPHVGGAASGYKRLVDSSLDWGMALPALKRWLAQHDPEGQVPLHLAYFGTDEPAHHGITARRLPGFFERRSFEQYPLMPGYYAISASLLQGVYTSAFGPWNREYERVYRFLLRKVLAFEQRVPDPAQRAALLLRPEYSALANEIDLFDNLRFSRLCAWLRQRGKPPHQVGHSILIWRLDYADLTAALFDLPVEMANRPARIRRYRQIVPPGQ